jgi:hypothetical protein
MFLVNMMIWMNSPAMMAGIIPQTERVRLILLHLGKSYFYLSIPILITAVPASSESATNFLLSIQYFYIYKFNALLSKMRFRFLFVFLLADIR